MVVGFLEVSSQRRLYTQHTEIAALTLCPSNRSGWAAPVMVGCHGFITASASKERLAPPARDRCGKSRRSASPR